MKHPVFVSGPIPQYTPDALRKKLQGRVIARCHVTNGGDVRNCRIVESFDPSMGRAVVNALQRRRYTPATQDGRPVDVEYDFTVTFRLPGEGPQAVSSMCQTLAGASLNPDGLAVRDEVCFCYRGSCVGKGTPEHDHLLRVKACREGVEARLAEAQHSQDDVALVAR